MPEARILRIYLDPVMLKMGREGTFGFVNRVSEAFEGAGFRVDLVRDGETERLKSAARRGYSLFLMKEPFHPRALSMRRAYYYPYWRIERSAERWAFDVARKPFDSSVIDPNIAEKWTADWGRYLFGDAPARAVREAMIYVPLQGRLLEHRKFQHVRPLDMIHEVQARAGDRRIVIGLHPGEIYTADEMTALQALTRADSRMTLQTGGMQEALRRCDLVVTQNSTAALSGFFFEKPAILFAKADFHHQMPAVAELGIDEAFRRARDAKPDFARYLYWFIHLNAIKADEPDAPARIIARCRTHGWNV
ncbi:hypothetical protein [Maritimibacter fusiformis]|uniref:Capsule polysaccharide biosynthesis protein n=1 Tax=Maritimibacter fusiformis TaxID=2603819 RepID=A0A5D0RAJ2_9RHOB|nr:hypothetical protein [Maritimibacter fusiformis]TYB77718.1 hypothetical protein FVF75_15800 [Maritimibacter fusiformis]